MPPSSLVDHAQVKCDWWTWQTEDKQTWRVPQGMKYTFNR